MSKKEDSKMSGKISSFLSKSPKKGSGESGSVPEVGGMDEGKGSLSAANNGKGSKSVGASIGH